MKKKRRFFNKTIVATILLIIVMIANMAGSIKMLNGYIEKEAFQVLWDNLDSMRNEIVQTVNKDKEHLDIIATVIAEKDQIDTAVISDVQHLFNEESMINNLYILLPDNTLLSSDGEAVSNSSGLDFEEESVKDYYISSREEQFADLNEKVIYQAIPIKKDGEIKGILYGVVRLQQMSELYEVTCFDGQAHLNLIESKSGSFLLDTWHTSLGNLDDMGGRETKPGYDFTTTSYEIRNGIRGMTVFVSKTIGRYMYFCYEPVGINDWMVALVAPEPVVFKNSEIIQRNLWVTAGIEVIAVVLYFVWILYHKKREDIEKEAQLNQVSYMYDIQKTLFDAHQKPARMSEALGRVGKKLRSEMVFFIVTEDKKICNTYTWTAPGIVECNYDVSYYDIEDELDKDEGFLLYDIKKIETSSPAVYDKLKKLGIRNIMLKQIKEADGKIMGILGTWNMSHVWKDTAYLDCVAMQFFSAYKNIRNRAVIDEMASVDALTGLLNRNSHELALKRYAQSLLSQIACIYIDVNGLHEINNYLGHAAGDEMLRCVAAAVQQFFGKEDTYRIGGDEFLIFVFDTSEDEINQNIDRLLKKVESKGYHISVGMEYRTEAGKMKDLISAAEKKMYEVKKEYYRKNKNVGKEREMNRKLEEILLEKKDAEIFLSVLAPRFAGVYIINLENERVRDIYIPDYFKELIDKNDGNFHQAFQDYIEQFVVKEEQAELCERLRLDSIKEYFEENDAAYYLYRKTDGTQMQLNIYKTAGYKGRDEETIWIFEKMK